MSYRRDKLICKVKDCLTKTCSKHRCNISKRWRKKITWVDGDNCEMYKSRNQWRTMYVPPLFEPVGDIDETTDEDTEEVVKD